MSRPPDRPHPVWGAIQDHKAGSSWKTAKASVRFLNAVNKVGKLDSQYAKEEYANSTNSREKDYEYAEDSPRSRSYLAKKTAQIEEMPPGCERQPTFTPNEYTDSKKAEYDVQNGQDLLDSLSDDEPGSHPNDSPVEKLRYKMRKMLRSPRVDMTIGLVITLNSVLIGVDLSYSLEVERGTRDPHSPVMQFLVVMENFCLVVYTVELALRFTAFGLACLKSGWVRFDTLLVAVGLVNKCIIAPLNLKSDKLAPLLVLRVMRLLRLARAVRLVVQFKTLWMLVRGLISSALTVLYTMVLNFIVLYVFGCLSIELITRHPMARVGEDTFDQQFYDIVDMHFSNLQVSMLTLVQFIFMDSAGAIYTPLVMRDPSLMLFFVAVMLIVSISLMNLVTAVIVEGALDQARSDKEALEAYEADRIKQLIPGLKDMFHHFDTDGNGELSKAEVASAPKILKDQLTKIMSHGDAVEVFEMLDVDQSGSLAIEEFCDGIKDIVTMGDDQVHYMRLHKGVTSVKERVGKLEENVERRMTGMENKIDMLLRHMGVPNVSAGSRVFDQGPPKSSSQASLPGIPGQVSSRRISNNDHGVSNHQNSFKPEPPLSDPWEIPSVPIE